MYLDVLRSVTENDIQKLGSICEKNLYREFHQGIEWLQPKVKNIEIMNLEDYDPEDKSVIDIQVVDFYTFFGVYIDRELNRELGIVRQNNRLLP